jgi:hypothetical protein
MEPRSRRPLTPDEHARRRALRRQQQVRRRRAGAALVLAAAIGGVTAWAATASSDSPATEAAGSSEAAGASAPRRGGTTAASAARRAAGRPVTIGWAGDAVPASDAFGLPEDPSILFGAVRSVLRRPDLMVGNLEGTLTTRGTSKCPGGSGGSCYAFRSPPGYARLFADAGFDVLNLANNHASDYGPVGLEDTRRALERVKIAHTGAPGQVAVRTVKGTRVAVVGFASYTWSAPLNEPAAVRALVRKAAGQADVVVVTFHGGAEGSDRQHVPNGPENYLGENRGHLRAFARTAVDAGADLVVGSGPHVLRGLEVYKGRLVAYSTGNFVGWKTFSLSGALSQSCVLEVTLRPDGGWVRGRIVPTRLVGEGSAAPDPDRQAVAVMRELSQADFGARAPRISDSGEITLPSRS